MYRRGFVATRFAKEEANVFEESSEEEGEEEEEEEEEEEREEREEERVSWG